MKICQYRYHGSDDWITESRIGNDKKINSLFSDNLEIDYIEDNITYYSISSDPLVKDVRGIHLNHLKNQIFEMPSNSISCISQTIVIKNHDGLITTLDSTFDRILTNQSIKCFKLIGAITGYMINHAKQKGYDFVAFPNVSYYFNKQIIVEMLSSNDYFFKTIEEAIMFKMSNPDCEVMDISTQNVNDHSHKSSENQAQS